MKNNMKKIIISLFAFAFLFMGNSVFAYVSWNTSSNDCPGSGIGNYTTGAGIPPTGSNNCWNLTNVSATPGQTINVQLYYHNTGNQPATNTKVYISVSPAIGTASTVHTFTSSLTASPSGTALGTTTLTLPTAQALTFGSTYWYPNQSSTPIMSGSEIITSNGLYLGTINQGWPSQGSVVVSFQVNNPPPCSITNFNANPNQINLGGSSTLSWATNNCVSASISPGIGNVNPSSGSQIVYPTQTTTYTLTATGANGGPIYQTKTVTVLQPNCSITNFNANPNQINLGGSSTLSWATSNCLYTNISTIGNVPTSGSQVVSPTITTTYVLTATGANGASVTQSKTVTVIQPNCSITNFNASPNQINLGQSSTLSWATNNCVSASISPGIGNVNLTGSQVVYPTQTTTYTLTATGANGSSIYQTKTVIVLQPNCSITNFNASPSSINLGQSSTLSWATSNCTYVSISTIGNVNLSGSQIVYPIQTTTYVLTATGANGSSVTQSKTVTVIQPNCSITNFNASPNQINLGQSSTLSWATSNCTYISISGIGNVNPTGSQVVYPTQTTTYTLTATGSNGSSIYQTVTVTVLQSNCSITNFIASPNQITSGQPSTLTWATNNCTSASITGVGSVPVNGSQIVYPSGTTTYTLTAYGSNGSPVTQSVTVTVNQSSCTINSFTANPNQITLGQSSTLSWNTTNCISVNISNVGNVNPTGSQVVYPNQSTTYILTAYGSNGLSIYQTVRITVNN